MAEFSPQIVSPDQGYLASTHKGEDSSKAKSVEFQLVSGDHKVVKNPPQNAKTTIAGEIIEVLEVVVEPPQIDLTSA